MKRWMGMLSAFSAGIVLIQPISAMAKIHISDMPASEAREAPSIPVPGTESGRRGVLSRSSAVFDELLPFVMASPDQEDAGSCLYMAITGIAEWWLARLNPTIARTPDGPLDLSERYIMNVAGMEEDETSLDNWRTDSIYLFNRSGNKSVLNSAYRYTKGWYLGESYSDHLKPVSENTPKAEYGTIFNWIDQRPAPLTSIVRLPKFRRDVIFADPEHNQWNVGVAPDNIADQVKQALRTKKAPVLVIYNHNSYWHAVYIIGYNDKVETANCGYTQNFRYVIAERAQQLAKKAEEATDPAVKQAYEIRAKRAFEAQDKIERAYAAGGGCKSTKGVFYVRDSIYPDAQGPVYHYDLSKPSADAPYAKKIITKEYDWLRYFANHVSVIYPEEE